MGFTIILLHYCHHFIQMWVVLSGMRWLVTSNNDFVFLIIYYGCMFIEAVCQVKGYILTTVFRFHLETKFTFRINYKYYTECSIRKPGQLVPVLEYISRPSSDFLAKLLSSVYNPFFLCNTQFLFSTSFTVTF